MSQRGLFDPEPFTPTDSHHDDGTVVISPGDNRPYVRTRRGEMRPIDDRYYRHDMAGAVATYLGNNTYNLLRLPYVKVVPNADT